MIDQSSENKKFTILSYIPFIGWMAPVAFQKNNSFAMAHARQALIMALFFTVALILLTFSTVFIPRNLRVLNFIVIMIIYILDLLYLGLCIIGTVMIGKGRKIEFPIIKNYTKLLGI
ncbi:hypothetical protein ACFL20_11365 [Spirochaetota bacterium]